MSYTIKRIEFTELNELAELKGFNSKTLHSILTLITNNYLNKEGNTVSIKADHFLSISNKYKEYLEFLKSENIILINEHWSDGSDGKKAFTKRYGFTDYFKNMNHKYLIKLEETAGDFETQKNIVDPYIKKRLTADYKKLEAPNKPIKSFNSINVNEVLDFKKYLLDQIQLLKIKGESGYYKWRNNRLYTNFSYCSAKTRSAFKLEGKSLNSKDIKSSFPVFFCKLIKQEFNEFDYETNDFINTVLYKDIYMSLLNNFIKTKDQVLTESKYQTIKIEESKTDYSYDHLINDTLYWYVPYYSRDLMKIYFQILINSKTDLTKKEPYWVFNVYYQQIMDMIIQLQKKYPSIDGLKENGLYFKLEELEADWLYNTIIKRLYNEIKNIKIISNHDSIYYQSEFEDEVNKIWSEEINKLKNNIKPEIKESKVEIQDIEKAPILFKPEPKKRLTWSELNKGKEIFTNEDWQNLYKQNDKK